jgi:hypothetical protein
VHEHSHPAGKEGEHEHSHPQIDSGPDHSHQH